MKTLILVSTLLINLSTQASIVESLLLRDKIKVNKLNLGKTLAVKTIKLRTTKGIDQKDSLFCWAYSTANLLETSLLEKNPNLDPEAIELSRWYMENGVPNIYHLGTVIDALYTYTVKIGYVKNTDYKRGTYEIPETINFNNQKLTPLELRALLIGDKKYTSYAISETQSGWGPHLDPDATAGKKSFYISRSDLPKLIKNSLEKKEALAFWYDEHIVTLYGADYDLSGNPIKYYIKDSYHPYFYEARAEETHKIIIEITGISELI